MLLNPRNTLGILDAVTKLLGGQSDLTPLNRLRLKLFYLIVRLNNTLKFLDDPRPPEVGVPHA